MREGSKLVDTTHTRERDTHTGTRFSFVVAAADGRYRYRSSQPLPVGPPATSSPPLSLPLGCRCGREGNGDLSRCAHAHIHPRGREALRGQRERRTRQTRLQTASSQTDWLATYTYIHSNKLLTP
eukprot:GHVU01038455.1.p2 GENE.GHVU01038455.1~~GHVU01038455.1.p2  ORF type:complete len:125 (-),score=13.37 GHVU01038455.1:131-505(-)